MVNNTLRIFYKVWHLLSQSQIRHWKLYKVDFDFAQNLVYIYRENCDNCFNLQARVLSANILRNSMTKSKKFEHQIFKYFFIFRPV